MIQTDGAPPRPPTAMMPMATPTKKILVVDDEADILHFLELVLRERGYDVLTAGSGRQAVELARDARPDLVLLDIMMPQMDGWEVLKLLRVDEVTAAIPVAMVSARTDPKDRVQGLQEGAVDYICKPFALDDLLAKVDAIFAHTNATKGA
jgi:DNA-binding response OmpR family regulator